MTFSLDTPYMQSVASSRAGREGLHTAHAQAHKARYQYYLLALL
jgi:hypothetical protein